LGYTPEPLNVPPIADTKVKVYNLDGSVSYEDYGGGSSGATPVTKAFTYTGGAQEFIVDTPIIKPDYILVGNISLQLTQFTWSGSKFTITDTLTDGAVIEIGYWDDTTFINSIAPDGVIASGNVEAVSGGNIYKDLLLIPKKSFLDLTPKNYSANSQTIIKSLLDAQFLLDGTADNVKNGVWTIRTLETDINGDLKKLSLGLDLALGGGFVLYQMVTAVGVGYGTTTLLKENKNSYYINRKGIDDIYGDVKILLNTKLLGASFFYSVYPSNIVFNQNFYTDFEQSLIRAEFSVDLNAVDLELQTQIDINKSGLTNNNYNEVSKLTNDAINLHNLKLNKYGFGISNGIEYINSSLYVTPFLKINPSTNYFTYGYNRICFYDKNKVYVSSLEAGLSSFTTASTVYYARAMGLKSTEQSHTFFSTTNAFTIYKEIVPQDNLFSQDVKFNLETDKDLFARYGGKVHSGVYGADSCVYKLPMFWNGKTTIDFDFISSVDFHSVVNSKILLEITADNSADTNTLYPSLYTRIQLDKQLQGTTLLYGAPTYNTNLSGQFSAGTIGNAVNVSRYLKNNLNGEHAFSFRKLNPVTADLDMTCEITTTAFIVAKADLTVLQTFTFSTYPTIEALGNAINAITDYEVKFYNYQSKNSIDLSIIKIIVVAEVPEISETAGTYGAPTGSNIIDNYECFFPLSGKGVVHKCKLTIEEKTDTNETEAIFYFDGYPIFKKVISGIYSAEKSIYLGGNVNADSIVEGSIKNVRLRSEIVEPPYGIAVMSHAITDTSISVGGNDSVKSYEKMITEIKERGYTFVNSNTFINIANGILQEGEFPQKFAVIFQDDWQPEAYSNRNFRNMYKRQGVKPILPIIFNYTDTATASELKALEMARSDGWGIWGHSVNHIEINEQSYDNLIAMLNEQQTYANTLGYDIDSMIYPGNYSDSKSIAVLKAYGINVGGSSSTYARMYLGVGNYQWTRVNSQSWFDATDKNTVDNIDDAIKHW